MEVWWSFSRFKQKTLTLRVNENAEAENYEKCAFYVSPPQDLYENERYIPYFILNLFYILWFTWTFERYEPNFELLPIFYDSRGQLSITDLILNFYLYFMIHVDVLDVWALQI